jgi:hypothetical protein
MRNPTTSYQASMSPAITKQRLQAAIGVEVVSYVTTALAADGQMYSLFPSEQDPRVTDDLARKGAHVLSCGPCCPDCT